MTFDWTKGQRPTDLIEFTGGSSARPPDQEALLSALDRQVYSELGVSSAMEQYASRFGVPGDAAYESALNRLFNSSEAAAQRDWQSKQAELTRRWEAELSNTAFTRATADLKTAGLNPILAVSQGGASSPSAQTPVGSSASATSGASSTSSDTVSSQSSMLSTLASIATTVLLLAITKGKGLKLTGLIK